jgi:DNA invertase Pin-like site-specific DNA recombinase
MVSAAGTDLVVIQENVNTRSPMGRFIFTLFSALVRLECEQIAERTFMSHEDGVLISAADFPPYRELPGWTDTPQ